MVGDYSREASVLILVFGALDPLFHDPELPASLRGTLSWLANPDGKIHPVVWYSAVIIGSLLLLWFGMHLERKR